MRRAHLWQPFSRLVGLLWPGRTKPPGIDGGPEDQALLRSELFSADQMEQHGKVLAQTHRLGASGLRDRLLKRLDENQVFLVGTCGILTQAVKAKLPIAPAGEWLLDNFYLIEDQIRTARNHLPRGYSRQLPRLGQGPSRDLPRVYDLALEAISHGDGRVDAETLGRFIAAYQTVTPLKLGELWAIPIMLRLALIENLRRVSARITTARLYVNLAQDWANQMTETAESDPKSLIVVIADMARSNPPMVSSFVAELARRLQGHGPTLAMPLTWVEQRLAESSQTIEQLVLSENQQQAADQVSIANTIGSMRFLGATDWRIFVETMSVVERALLRDCDGVYGRMDFATRDGYRHVIDDLGKRSSDSEEKIANTAIELSHLSAGRLGIDHVSAHVGYYLMGAGRIELERSIHFRTPLSRRIGRAAQTSSLALYLGSMLLIAEVSAGALAIHLLNQGVGVGRVILLALLILVISSQLACALINWVTTLIVKPQRLPRMEFSGGVPPDMRTLTVIPTLLGSVEGVENLLETLEVRFLGNRDPSIHFGLLTDFQDAPQQTLPGDSHLRDLAAAGIVALNDKYRDPGCDRFYLFHRPRTWNPLENVWMGRERKRGKLNDLNGLLRGRSKEAFDLVVGDREILPTIRYVITLDTDTQLPRDCARQMIGAMAHPLNRPRFEGPSGRVTQGYGILQPRIAASFSDIQPTRYARLSGSEPGIDPYTRAISDVYQDLFGEGSFIGKGIYDVDAFERALLGRLPDDRILSHDLLEGCFARSGLLSDVDLFEEYPSRYLADMDRQRRWIRGDWQIADWALPVVPRAGLGRVANTLSTLSRSKILDNLRRSLVTPAMVLVLLLAWGALPQAWLYSLAVIGVFFFPPLLISCVDTFRGPDDVDFSSHLSDVMRSSVRHALLATFRTATLPHEALVSVGAILQTSWRTLVTHRGLLEWSESGRLASGTGEGLAATYRAMWIAPALGVVASALLAWGRPWDLLPAFPIVLLWVCAPTIAWSLSRPVAVPDPELSVPQRAFLRRIARKTWFFFENFVGPDDNWLPPDNFQVDPGPAIAHRTSPTNIGMALLANLAAYDFGYVTARLFLERTACTFRTLEKLERHEGHFYNWYDTRTLVPLPPRYISSVDSGNLAAHLLTLRMGILAIANQPIVSPQLFEGLADTLTLVEELAPPEGQACARRGQELLAALRAVHPTSVAGVLLGLTNLQGIVKRLTLECEEVQHEQALSLHSLLVQTEDAIAELHGLLPWLAGATDARAAQGYPEFAAVPSLSELSVAIQKCRADLVTHEVAAIDLVERERLAGVGTVLESAAQKIAARVRLLAELAAQAAQFAIMDFELLYDPARHLLSIGYNVDDFRRDNSFYDLLASEARLGTFTAIAQGQLPQESWFALGRLRTNKGGAPILVSWSGSMFEYLMPLLVMPNYEDTLLFQTCNAAVTRQISYGIQRGLPWGVSESGYNVFDAALNYQYHAFGVPGSGFKRGLADDLVVAPYASALALMVLPKAATANLDRLAAAGLEGAYGFYEAVDYTPGRLARGQTSVIIRSFMAHHQGMNLLSLAYLLLDRPMQRRFESDPEFRATLLLLQERIPRNSVFQRGAGDHSAVAAFPGPPELAAQVPIGWDTLNPEVKLLSNGRYHVMVTNAGGGYSRWRDLSVTRWREDGTCDNWGSFLYLRDVESGEYWSAAYQPTLKRATSYEATFSAGRAEYRRRDLDFETYSEIVVSPEDDIELRRVRVTNHSRRRRVIELTSYAEVVLASAAADAMQPSFGKLFVETEIIATRQAILCTRRARSEEERSPWMFHLLGAHGPETSEVSYETDRMRFIGRGQTTAAPRALDEDGALSGSAGSVLDPIVAIRFRVELAAGQAVSVDLVSGVAESREVCMSLVEKYQDRHLADRVFDVAWTHSAVALRQINALESDAQLYSRLAGSVIFASAALRAEPSVMLQNQRGQSGLWSYSISGDLPIVLLKVSDNSHIDLARQLVQCHAYWRIKGLAVDLVILIVDHIGYRQRLLDQVMALITHGNDAHATDRSGGIFIRPAEQIPTEDRVLLRSVARVIITGGRGSLSEQVNRRALVDNRVPKLVPPRSYRAALPATPDRSHPGLTLVNPMGGFGAEGSEYVITTTDERRSPLPWVNVLANPNFGTVISESGIAYTWSENAHEYRLTPWSDDPVGASGGEAFYLRDEETGHFWSPAPWPAPDSMPYTTRHGFGYSVFEHTCAGIQSELRVYVDLVARVKFSVLKVRNRSGRPRHLSATGYVEWVLGDLRPKTAMHLVTEIDAASGALLARNIYNSEFADRVAFFDVDAMSRTLTGDRAEFLGRNRTHAAPEAMTRARLSGRLGAALDPCGAIHVPFELADGQDREIIFRLGSGQDIERTRSLVQQLRRTGSARTSLERVREFWTETLGTVRIDTPDTALNTLANGWLVYQTLACRMWARSGYYQSGGAFGFRDQLQDSMALVHVKPALLREQILRCASRQYPEGDVQHWWHPPSGRGVRTKCSDDYLWLPMATCRYVAATGDRAILAEPIGYLEGRRLDDDEESHYDLPDRSALSENLYEHCLRAIRHGLRFGVHGLPLMGSGDWNDGMNLVGIHGQGESVWLGFFLYEVLNEFALLSLMQGDQVAADLCRSSARQLQVDLELHAWDGAWYRRAYFDDGTPLGSATNPECQIDSIAQSWSVLSRAGSANRTRLAMEALDAHLVHRQAQLVVLLEPPFDRSAMNPGYIKGYVPGVRENGGQYTHAALWAAMAFAGIGNNERVWELIQMINPINHALSGAQIDLYKAEPYVVAADVYALAPHVGRGGWTWYTGSAGWFYRLILESFLGVTLEDGHRLRFAPCLPREWPRAGLSYRFGTAEYQIEFIHVPQAPGLPDAVTVTLDGVPQEDNMLELTREARHYHVEVRIPYAAGGIPGEDEHVTVDELGSKPFAEPAAEVAK